MKKAALDKMKSGKDVVPDKPISINKEMCECRYGIITTNGKSLDFQGVHAFAVIYSISFPS